MPHSPDEFEVYLFQALMFLTILFALFGGLGWVAEVLERCAARKDRRTGMVLTFWKSDRNVEPRKD